MICYFCRGDIFPDSKRKKEEQLLYLRIIAFGFLIGVIGSFLSPWGMLLTFFFPVIWMLLENKKEYWMLALGYYCGASVENPWLVKNFLSHFTPHHGWINLSLGLIGTGVAIVLLSLTWVFPNPKTFGERYRYVVGMGSILLMQVIVPMIPGFE